MRPKGISFFSFLFIFLLLPLFLYSLILWFSFSLLCKWLIITLIITYIYIRSYFVLFYVILFHSFFIDYFLVSPSLVSKRSNIAPRSVSRTNTKEILLLFTVCKRLFVVRLYAKEKKRKKDKKESRNPVSEKTRTREIAKFAFHSESVSLGCLLALLYRIGTSRLSRLGQTSHASFDEPELCEFPFEFFFFLSFVQCEFPRGLFDIRQN